MSKKKTFKVNQKELGKYFYSGYFVDKFDNEHEFVLCGVVSIGNFDEYSLSIGLSIANPTDVFDLEEGKMRAYGKAVSDNRYLSEYISYNKDDFKSFMVNAILKEKADSIAYHPEKHVKSLETAYLKKRELEDKILSLELAVSNNNNELSEVKQSLEQFIKKQQVKKPVAEMTKESGTGLKTNNRK